MKYICNFIFLISIFIICHDAHAADYKSVVKGRVVDDTGKPISRAIVSLESQPKNEFDKISSYETVFTDKHGRFTVENISTKAVRERELFISGPFPENYISTFSLPPDSNLRRLQPNLLVKTLTLNKNKSVNIGDLKIKVGVVLVEISIVKSSGQPYFQTAGDWQSHFYNLGNEDGEPIAITGISISDTENGVNVQEGVIRFAVPEGIWYFKFISDLEDLNSVIVKTDKFSVKRGDEPIKIRLIVP